MMLLESPAPSAGIAAWRRWARQLEALPTRMAGDASVKLAKSRAEKMIRIMAQFPEGMSVKDPNFLKTVREFSK